MKTMKKFIIAAALLLAGFATASAQKIKGSDTVLPLSQKEAEEYMKVNPSATVTVTGGVKVFQRVFSYVRNFTCDFFRTELCVARFV